MSRPDLDHREGPWLPRALRGGDDPDPRFTLANERTFLAWMRTAMALVAGAVGFDAFGDSTVTGPVRVVLVFAMLAGAVILAVYAFRRWLGVEQALRQGRSLPIPSAGPLLVVIVGGVAAALLVAVALR